MGVSRLIDRVEDTMAGVLQARSAPEDRVEYGAVMFPLLADDQSRTEPVLTLWLSLAESEGLEQRSAHVVLPLDYSDSAHLTSWVNRLWDHLEFSRICEGLEVETGGGEGP